jgi:hypothetical protein
MMEDYNAQGGIVSNNENNVKVQEAFEQAQEQTNGHASCLFVSQGIEDHFGNKNALPHTRNPSPDDLAKWNATHPGVPYPSYTKGPFGMHGKEHESHGGAIGKVNHGGAHAGNSNHDIISGQK